MPRLAIDNAVSSSMENWSETEIPAKNTDGISDTKETEYTNPDFTKYWGMFTDHPELKTAILMKAIWNVGKGYTSDIGTEKKLDLINGIGKDTFNDILFNMEVIRYVNGDSYAEIMRGDDGTLINLKTLDPSTIKIIFDEKGIIERYEQTAKLGDSKKVINKWKPQEIFHLSNNRLADQIHGISVIDSLDNTLLAEVESFNDGRKVMHRQAKPFIIFKLKTDDKPTIDALVAKINKLREQGEDLFIPDDENILSYEVVQVNISNMILAWRQDVTNRFYRALGLPLVLFGTVGSTESGGKMEVFAHEQVFNHDQIFLEKQIWNQLGIKIDLVSPTSLGQNLQGDEAKDGDQGLEIQPNDTEAGVGR